MPIEDWRSTARRSAPKATQEVEGIYKPVLGVIESVSTDTERVGVSDYGGSSTVRVTHPYIGIRAWDRVMPEEGSAAVLTRRGDSAESEISYYWSGHPESRVTKYRSGVGYYRPLDRGEFERSSYGLAQIFGSRNGGLDLRGGITRGWLNNQELEVGFKAPTHRRVLHDDTRNRPGQERFGAVWRRPIGSDSLIKFREYPKVDGSFAKEYMRVLSFQGSPATLLDHREGHVYDDDGTRPTSPAASPLRSRTIIYDGEGDQSLSMVDERGNTWEFVSVNATSGKAFRIPSGSFRIEAGRDIKMQASKDITGTATNMIVRVKEVLHLESDIAIKIVSRGIVAIEAPIIEMNGRAVNIASAPI